MHHFTNLVLLVSDKWKEKLTLKGLLFDWGCNVHTTRTSIHGIGWLISSLLRLSILRFRWHSKLYSLLRSPLSGCHATLPQKGIGRGWGVITCDELWKDWPPIFPFSFWLPIPPQFTPARLDCYELRWYIVKDQIMQIPQRSDKRKITRQGRRENEVMLNQLLLRNNKSEIFKR